MLSRTLAVLATLILLSGCASLRDPGIAGGSPSPSPSASPSLCPTSDEAPKPAGCIPYDPEANQALNELCREHMPIPAENQADADAALAAITAALTPFAEGSAALTESAAVAAIAEAGFEGPALQTWSAENRFAFWLEIDGGCIVGDIRPPELDIFADGYIMDGGCRPATGH